VGARVIRDPAGILTQIKLNGNEQLSTSG
jgi:hypothetical protein